MSDRPLQTLSQSGQSAALPGRGQHRAVQCANIVFGGLQDEKKAVPMPTLDALQHSRNACVAQITAVSIFLVAMAGFRKSFSPTGFQCFGAGRALARPHVLLPGRNLSRSCLYNREDHIQIRNHLASHVRLLAMPLPRGSSGSSLPGRAAVVAG